MKIYSNIVPEDKVRKVQRETLDIISKALCQSFGPKGSTTTIIKNMDKDGVNITVERTKDGHNIVKNIMFLNPIERSVQDTLTELTRYVVKEVGDGTTSAIILCKTVFDCLCDNPAIVGASSSDIIQMFDNVIKELSDRILAKGRECTIDDIYDIAIISTNNNEYLSGTIAAIYKKFGLGVYIDVGTTSGTECIIKEYDGMTMDVGYTDLCFVNDKANNRSIIRNPRIYCFNDPIDTPEMANMVNAIIDTNIMRAYTPNSMYEPVPTVIFCKKISPDTSSSFERVVKLMNAIPDVPLLIVSDVFQDYLYEDIAKLCGAKFIKKYLNPDIQKVDIEAGLAPTIDNIVDFCGYAEEVDADQYKTMIKNPAKMFNEDGSKSDEYNNLLVYLENQVQKCIDEGESIEHISQAKRRLNCVKGNMVDLLIGGLTPSDRDNLKASVEDAVLNCRSAAVNGVGYGANFMAFSTLNEMKNEDAFTGNVIVNILFDAYEELLTILYGKSFSPEDTKEIIAQGLSYGSPMNIRTNEYDQKVLSSIKSDVIVLETIDKILSLMYTCNQYLAQTPVHNIYSEPSGDDED